MKSLNQNFENSLLFYEGNPALREVLTSNVCFNFEEPWNVDQNGSDQCRQNVVGRPVGSALLLPVVMRSAHSKKSFHTNSNDQVNASTQAYPYNDADNNNNKYGLWAKIRPLKLLFWSNGWVGGLNENRTKSVN